METTYTLSSLLLYKGKCFILVFGDDDSDNDNGKSSLLISR